MATTNNVIVPNFPVSTMGGTENFNTVWKLTRALKKAGWKYVASSNGTLKDTSGNPATDYWNTTPGVVGSLVSSGASAVINAPSAGRASVTGLSGITSADKGRFLVISGSATPANNNAHQIEEIISATEVKIDARTFAVAADAGPLAWEIRDACIAAETYPTALNTVSAWWCAKGPSILQIPITAAPVAGVVTGSNLLRGENIVQSTTGAEGELRGWVFNPTTSTGYLVVHPRVRGTGVGPYGWDTSNLITGSLTGATVTQVGTAIQYQAEIVFWKATNTNSGSLFYGWFNPALDSMMSDAAHLTNATATVAPGGGAGANSFPTYAIVGVGTNTTGTHARWDSGSTSPGLGNSHILAIDCIEEQKYTADGSFTFVWAIFSTGIPYTGFTFQVVDDGEDGDLFPYVIGHRTNTSVYGQSRTANSNWNTTDGIFNMDNNNSAALGVWTFSSGNFGYWRGWFRRGLSGTEAFQGYEAISDVAGQTNARLESRTTSTPERLQTSPGFLRLRMPVRLVSYAQNRKTRKGTLRYWWIVQGGLSNDTYDNKKYVQLGSAPDSGNGVIGPWDGSTMPVGF